jgi:hypothetical protein
MSNAPALTSSGLALYFGLSASNSLRLRPFDATSLLDYADNEAQTPVEKLQSLNNQINDGSIQFVKDGDTLSTALDICSSSPAARAYILRLRAIVPSARADTGLNTITIEPINPVKDATSLLDYADNEAQTPVEKLQSLNNQINDGSIQFVKDGDTLSQIAQDGITYGIKHTINSTRYLLIIACG